MTVVPGLVGMRLGLRSTAPGRIVLEASVRVRDVDDKLADDNDRLLEVEPELFLPSSVVMPE